MNLPDNRVFDAFVRISDHPKESWSERVEACSELTDSEKTHLKLLLEESDQTKNRIEEPVVDESFKRSLEQRGITILRQLGAGGMGVVFEGFETSTGRRVAVKRLRAEGRLLEGDLSREIGHLSKVHQTNICSLYFAGEFDVDGNVRPYFVMEYVDGVPIDVYFNVNQISKSVFCSVLLQLIEGVYHAHSLGVVHRDLKPSNIFINREGTLKILDFGISDLCRSEGTGSVVQAEGSVGYASPSQMSGASPTQRMDVHAIGIILRELLENDQIKQELRTHERSKLLSLADRCLENSATQISLPDLRAKVKEALQPRVGKLSPFLGLLTTAFGLCAGFVLSEFYRPNEDIVDDQQKLVLELDQIVSDIRFSASNRVPVQELQNSPFFRNQNPDLLPGTISSSKLAYKVAHFELLWTSGLRRPAIEYLSSALQYFPEDEYASNPTFQFACLNLAWAQFHTSDFLAALQSLRLIGEELHDPIFEYQRQDIFESLDFFLDTEVFSAEENELIERFPLRKIELLNEAMSGPFSSSSLMLTSVDSLMTDYVSFGDEEANLPEGLKDFVTKVMVSLRSTYPKDSFTYLRFFQRWEAQFSHLAGQFNRAYELVSNTSKQMSDRLGPTHNWVLEALLVELELMSWHSRNESNVVGFDADMYLQNAQSYWDSCRVIYAEDEWRLYRSSEFLEEALLFKAIDLWREPSEQKVVLGNMASEQSLKTLQLGMNHYSSRPNTSWRWESACLFRQARATLYSGNLDRAIIQFSDLIEGLELSDAEAYRLEFVVDLVNEHHYTHALDYLIESVRNVGTHGNLPPTQYATEIQYLPITLNFFTEFDSASSSAYAENLKADRGFIRDLSLLKSSLMAITDYRERAYLLTNLADLYFQLNLPSAAFEILVESLSDCLEIVAESPGDSFLGPDDQEWWEYDIDLILKFVQSDVPSSMSDETKILVQQFVALAEEASRTTAWFDTPEFEQLQTISRSWNK